MPQSLEYDIFIFQLGYEGAESVLKRISKPKDVEVKELSKMFPSYRTKPGPSQKFDPGAKCVAAERQKKKKKSSVPKKILSAVTVVVLDKFSCIVPRGKVRQKLASSGKIQSIKFSRDMSPEQVRASIKAVFKLEEYTVLNSDSSGHALCKCADQDINGETIVGCKSSLYVCKEFCHVRI